MLADRAHRLRGKHCRGRMGALGIIVAMLVVTACGSSGGGADPSDQNDATAGTPVDGGTLTFAEFSSPRGLDPIVMTGYGTTGLIESLAVYDSLLRWDSQSQTYEPLTAESVTSNDDATAWTIRLRDGIMFTDGTPYDADAVVFNLNRQRSGQAGAPPCEQIVACPQNTVQSSYAASFIADVQVVDPLTVEVKLNQPWTGFQATLAAELGLIASPTALKKCEPTEPASNCAYNLNPVGAGPFMVTSFDPSSGIKMAKNPNYWGGGVHLDGMNFVNLSDGGGQKTYAALGTGQVNAAFLREPTAVKQAQDDGTPGFLDQSFGAAALLMNASSTHPTSDLKVRQAVLSAIDQAQIAQRVYNGATDASPDLLTESFTWYPGSVYPDPNTGDAEKLVDQAKSAGWNGSLQIISNNTKTSADTALLIQAQLKNAGIDAQLDATRDVKGATDLLVKGDFDLFLGGLGISNDGTAVLGLSKNFESDSPSNRIGISDPQLDEALKQLRTAEGDDELTKAYKTVEQELVRTAPVAPIATYGQFIVWSNNVHGVEPGIETSVYFADAWIDQ